MDDLEREQEQSSDMYSGNMLLMSKIKQQLMHKIFIYAVIAFVFIANTLIFTYVMFNTSVIKLISATVFFVLSLVFLKLKT